MDDLSYDLQQDNSEMDRLRCPSCKKPVNDFRLIRCISCGVIFSEYERSQQGILEQQKETLANEVAERVQNLLHRIEQEKNNLVIETAKHAQRRLRKDIIAAVLLLLTVSGLGLWQAYRLVIDSVSARIAAQFEEPRIRATLTEVAENRASKIIESEVRAPIEHVKQSTEQAIESVKKLQQETQKHLEDIVQESIFRPLDQTLKEKMIQSLQEMRSKYGASTPSIRIDIFTSFMSLNARLVRNELEEIFSSSGFIMSIPNTYDFGISGQIHIGLIYNEEFNNFALDLVRLLSFLFNHGTMYFNERMSNKETFAISILAEPKFRSDGSIFFK